MATTIKRQIKPGQKIPLRLALAQVELIVDKTFIAGELLDLLHHAKVRDNVAVAKCTLAQMDRLANHIELNVRNSNDVIFQKQLQVISSAIRTLCGLYCETESASLRAVAKQGPRLINSAPATDAPRETGVTCRVIPFKPSVAKSGETIKVNTPELSMASSKAAKLWAAVPVKSRDLLLANVYCSRCRGGVRITSISGKVVGGDLVLNGNCAVCGNAVARVVEGPDA